MATLVLALWLGASGAPDAFEPPVREAILRIARDTTVEVRTADRERVRGRLGAIHENGFELRQVQGGGIEARSFAYDEVRSVRDLSRPAYGRPILLGTLAVLGMTLAALLALAARLTG